jgi:hypothetical protein
MVPRTVSRAAATAVLATLAIAAGGATPGASAPALPAHAQLVSTTPADGATLESVEVVTMTFNEQPNASFVQVRVTGPEGRETQGDPEVDGTSVSQALVADLPAGDHTVTFRVVSVDGHPISGEFTFETTEGPATPGTPTEGAAATAEPNDSVPGVSAPAATTASTPTDGASDGGPPWLLVVLGGLVVLVLLAGGVMLARPRRDDGDSDRV